jgi:thioredoxin reductase (NADPH)
VHALFAMDFSLGAKEVAIVGAGDTAAEEALYLAKLATTVHMFIRKHEMRASKVMQERVFKSPNIRIYWNTEVEEVVGEKHVSSVRVFNNQTGEKQTISVSGFFVAIGHQPNSEIFKDWLDMDEAGYIKTVAGNFKNQY